jgi:hypothetical protein
MKKRKNREVKVATEELIYDENFNIIGERVKVISPSEVLAGRKELERAGADWVIRKYEEGGKISPRIVLKALAGIRALYAEDAAVTGRQIDVAIPFRLLDVIGSTLAGKDAWQREQAAARRAAVRQKYPRLNAAANEMQRLHPSWNEGRVIRAVAENEKASTRTVRRARAAHRILPQK